MKTNARKWVTTLISVLLLAAASGYASSTPINRQISIWLTVALFGGWIALRWRQSASIVPHKITLPLFVYLTLLALLLPLTPIAYASAERVLQGLVLLLGFLLVQDTLKDHWQATSWENALIFVAFITALGEAALTTTWFLEWSRIQGALFPLPPVGYRLAGIMFGHPNITAGFLNFAIMIVLVRALRAKSWTKRVFNGFLFTLFVIVAYFASSRGGWISMLAGIFTCILLTQFIIPWLRDKAAGSRWRPCYSAVDLSAGVLFIALLLLASYSFFFQAQTSPGHAPLSAARGGIWEPAWTIIKMSPAWGHGPGAFSIQYAKLRQIPPGFATSHAHNIVLQIAVDAGIIGIAVIAWGVILFLRGAWRTWKDADSEHRFSLAIYAGCFVALALHHGVDYLFEAPLYAFSVLVLLALTLRNTPQSERVNIAGRPAIAAVALLLTLYGAASAVLLRGNNVYWHGVQAGRQNQWAAAQEGICSAKESNPWVTLYAFQCGLAQAYVGYPDMDPTMLAAAKESLEMGLVRDPHWPVHWANLAALEWELGNHDEARTHMLRAIENAPRNAVFTLYMGWMEESLGNRSEALQWYSRALEMDPWIGFSQFLDSSRYKEEILQQLTPDAIERQSVRLAIEGYQALLGGEWGQAEQAFTRLIQLRPQDPTAYSGLALFHLYTGDLSQANQTIQLSLFMAPPGPSSPYSLHIAGMIASSQGQEQDARWYFEQSLNNLFNQSASWQYYDRTYLRYFLASDLVPWMQRAQIRSMMREELAGLADAYLQQDRLEEAQFIRQSLIGDE